MLSILSKALLSVLLLLFSAYSLRAQVIEEKRCNLEIAVPHSEFQQKLTQLVQEKKKTKAGFRTEEDQEIYRLPVVFHIIHQGEPIGTGLNLSAEQIYSQFQALNLDFRRLNPDTTRTPLRFKPVAADTRIEFVLARIDPSGKILAEAGINRYNGQKSQWAQNDFNQLIKPITIWDTDNYINIWVTKMTGGILGVATLPTLSGIQETTNWVNFIGTESTDGVIIDANAFGSNSRGNFFGISPKYNLGRTLTHEIGHFLGLLHISGDGGCNADDFCEDTPLQANNSFNCQTGRVSCGNVNMVENYMDYSDDSCLNLFTKEQAIRMRTVLENSPRRVSLRFSRAGNIPSNGAYAYFEASERNLCPSQATIFTQKAAIFGENTKIQSFQWFFPNGTPSSSNAPNPQVRYLQSGTYDVILIVRSNVNTDTLIRKNYVRVALPNANIQTLQQNFENLALIDGWKSTGNSWGRTNVGGFGLSTGSFLATNTKERDKISTIISPILNTQNKSLLHITFDMSYRAIAGKTDSLEIMLSNDCGESFKTIWKQGGNFLGTAVQSLFRTIPRNNDWEKVNLYVDINNTATARLIFKNINYEGSNLYIDNIAITALDESQITQSNVDFQVVPNFLLKNESAIVKENVQGMPVKFHWNFADGQPSTSTERILSVRYASEGRKNISLKVDNARFQNEISRQAVQVIAGKRLSNTGNRKLEIRFIGTNNYLAGHNTLFDRAKAEYFTDFGKYELLHGADIFFGYVEIFNSLSEVTFTIWSEQNGKPNQILATKKLPLLEIKRDVVRRQPTRIVLDNPIPAPESFFVGIQLNYSPFSNEKVAIYTAETLRNTAWELTAQNNWQQYNEPVVGKTGTFAFSHAIYPILSPEKGQYDKDFANRKILIYPNPTAQSVNVDYKEVKILAYQIYNSIGQLVKKQEFENESPLSKIDFSMMSPGLYLLVFETDKGIAVKKLVLVE